MAEKNSTTWQPTPENKGKATQLRIFAVILWLVAIVGEGVLIWLLLTQVPTPAIWIFLVGMVGIAVFAIAGSLLWKRSNRLDPASEKDKVRFFIQNQLGAFIGVIAFLPLIVFILLDKDTSKRDKTILGAVGAVLMAITVTAGADFSPVSKEDYERDENIVTQLKGSDEVFWSTTGDYFHLCGEVSDLGRTKSENLKDGTVADAYQDGMKRLTLKWKSEAVKQCAIVDAIPADLEDYDPEADSFEPSE